MKRYCFWLALCAVGLTGRPASAESWVFQRSYYSHKPAQRVQVGPRSVGGPYYTREQGMYVRSGYRRLYGTISIPGANFEQVNIVETWIQSGAQF